MGRTFKEGPLLLCVLLLGDLYGAGAVSVPVRVGFSVDSYFEESLYTYSLLSEYVDFKEKNEVIELDFKIPAGEFVVGLFDSLGDGGVNAIVQELIGFSILLETDKTTPFVNTTHSVLIAEPVAEPDLPTCVFDEDVLYHQLAVHVSAAGWNAGVTYNLRRVESNSTSNSGGSGGGSGSSGGGSSGGGGSGGGSGGGDIEGCYFYSRPEPFPLTWNDVAKNPGSFPMVPFGEWELVVQNRMAGAATVFIDDGAWGVRLVELTARNETEVSSIFTVGVYPEGHRQVHVEATCTIDGSVAFDLGRLRFSHNNTGEEIERTCSDSFDMTMLEGLWTLYFVSEPNVEDSVHISLSIVDVDASRTLLATYGDDLSFFVDSFAVGDMSMFFPASVLLTCDEMFWESTWDLLYASEQGWRPASPSRFEYTEDKNVISYDVNIRAGLWQLARYDVYGDSGLTGNVSVAIEGHVGGHVDTWTLPPVTGKQTYEITALGIEATNVTVMIDCVVQGEQSTWNLVETSQVCYFREQMRFHDFSEERLYEVFLTAGRWKFFRYDSASDGGISAELISQNGEEIVVFGDEEYSFRNDAFDISQDAYFTLVVRSDEYFSEGSWNLVKERMLDYYGVNRGCSDFDSSVYNMSAVLVDGDWFFVREDSLNNGGLGGKIATKTGDLLVDDDPFDYTSSSSSHFIIGSGYSKTTPVVITAKSELSFLGDWNVLDESGVWLFESNVTDAVFDQVVWLPRGRFHVYRTSSYIDRGFEITVTNGATSELLLDMPVGDYDATSDDYFDVDVYYLPDCYSEETLQAEPTCGDVLLKEGQPLHRFVVETRYRFAYKSWNLRDASGKMYFESNRFFEEGQLKDDVSLYLEPGKWHIALYNAWSDNDLWVNVYYPNGSIAIENGMTLDRETSYPIDVLDDGLMRFTATVECHYEATSVHVHILPTSDVNSFMEADDTSSFNSCRITFECTGDFSIVSKQFRLPPDSSLVVENPKLSEVFVRIGESGGSDDIVSLPPELTTWHSKLVMTPTTWIEHQSNVKKYSTTPTTKHLTTDTGAFGGYNLTIEAACEVLFSSESVTASLFEAAPESSAEPIWEITCYPGSARAITTSISFESDESRLLRLFVTGNVVHVNAWDNTGTLVFSHTGFSEMVVEPKAHTFEIGSPSLDPWLCLEIRNFSVGVSEEVHLSMNGVSPTTGEMFVLWDDVPLSTLAESQPFMAQTAAMARTVPRATYVATSRSSEFDILFIDCVADAYVGYLSSHFLDAPVRHNATFVLGLYEPPPDKIYARAYVNCRDCALYVWAEETMAFYVFSSSSSILMSLQRTFYEVQVIPFEETLYSNVYSFHLFDVNDGSEVVSLRKREIVDIFAVAGAPVDEYRVISSTISCKGCDNVSFSFRQEATTTAVITEHIDVKRGHHNERLMVDVGRWEVTLKDYDATGVVEMTMESPGIEGVLFFVQLDAETNKMTNTLRVPAVNDQSVLAVVDIDAAALPLSWQFLYYDDFEDEFFALTEEKVYSQTDIDWSAVLFSGVWYLDWESDSGEIDEGMIVVRNVNDGNALVSNQKGSSGAESFYIGQAKSVIIGRYDCPCSNTSAQGIIIEKYRCGNETSVVGEECNIGWAWEVMAFLGCNEEARSFLEIVEHGYYRMNRYDETGQGCVAISMQDDISGLWVTSLPPYDYQFTFNSTNDFFLGDNTIPEESKVEGKRWILFELSGDESIDNSGTNIYNPSFSWSVRHFSDDRIEYVADVSVDHVVSLMLNLDEGAWQVSLINFLPNENVGATISTATLRVSDVTSGNILASFAADGEDWENVKFDFVVGGQSVLLTRVSHAVDDAQELLVSGAVARETVSLEMCQSFEVDVNAEMAVGLRFSSVAIPPNVIVTRAFLELQVASDFGRDGDFFIYGENVPWSGIWHDARWNLQNRNRTEPVYWRTQHGESNSNWIRTTDVSPILQTIVNMTEWNTGNAVSFLIEGDGMYLIKSIESAPYPADATAVAARLFVSYQDMVAEVTMEPITMTTSMPYTDTTEGRRRGDFTAPTPNSYSSEFLSSHTTTSGLTESGLTQEGGSETGFQGCGYLCREGMMACWHDRGVASVMVTYGGSPVAVDPQPVSECEVVFPDSGQCTDFSSNIRPCSLADAIQTALKVSKETGNSFVYVYISMDLTPDIYLHEPIEINMGDSSTLLVIQSYESADPDLSWKYGEDLASLLANRPRIRGSGAHGLFVFRGGLSQLSSLAFLNGRADYGGAVYQSDGANIEYYDCIFSATHASFDGGAIYSAANSPVSLGGCLFKYNGVYASTNAVGVVSTTSQTGMFSCTFHTNSGTALAINSGFGELIDCEFIGNVGEFGGAVVIGNNAEVELTKSYFIRNSASMGGGLYVNGTLLVTSGYLERNSAHRGGAVYVAPTGHMILQWSTIQENWAYYGGALYSEGVMYLDESEFSVNSAFVDIFDSHWAEMGLGGAVYSICEGCEPDFFQCNFRENFAEANFETSTFMTDTPVQLYQSTTTEPIPEETFERCKDNPCEINEGCIDLDQELGYVGVVCECINKIECPLASLTTCPSEEITEFLTKDDVDDLEAQTTLLLLWTGCGKVTWNVSVEGDFVFSPEPTGSVTQHSCSEVSQQVITELPLVLKMGGLATGGYSGAATISYRVVNPITLAEETSAAGVSIYMFLQAPVSHVTSRVEEISLCPSSTLLNCTSLPMDPGTVVEDSSYLRLSVSTRDVEGLSVNDPATILRVYVDGTLDSVMTYTGDGSFLGTVVSPAKDFEVWVMLEGENSNFHVQGSPFSYNATCREGTFFDETTDSCVSAISSDTSTEDTNSIVMGIGAASVAITVGAAVFVWRFGKGMRHMLIKLFQETVVVSLALTTEVLDIATDVFAFLAVYNDDQLSEYHVPYAILICIALTASVAAISTTAYALAHIINSTRRMGKESLNEGGETSGRVRERGMRSSVVLSEVTTKGIQAASVESLSTLTQNAVGTAQLVASHGVDDGVMLHQFAADSSASTVLQAAQYKVKRLLIRRYAKVAMLIFEDIPMLTINTLIEFKNDELDDVDLSSRRAVRLAMVLTCLLIGSKVTAIVGIPGLHKVLNELKTTSRRSTPARPSRASLESTSTSDSEHINRSPNSFTYTHAMTWIRSIFIRGSQRSANKETMELQTLRAKGEEMS